MKIFNREFFRKKDRGKEIEQSPILFEESQEIIRKLKTFYEGDVLSYWMPKWVSMEQPQIYVLNKIITKHKNSDRLFVILKSFGGSGEAALRAVHLFRHYYKEVVVLVTLECASAATLLALGADKIKMGPIAHLSPIDTTTVHELGPYVRNYFPARVNHVELERALKLWEGKSKKDDPNMYTKMFKYIHPLVIGAVDRANSFSEMITEAVQAFHEADGDKTRRISNDLNFNYPDHSYPIMLKEAQKLGLNAEKLESAPNEWLMDLNHLYSKSCKVALTEYNPLKQHTNQIWEIIEMEGEKMFYQLDFESQYNKELRYWLEAKEKSAWKSVTWEDEEEKVEDFYIN